MLKQRATCYKPIACAICWINTIDNGWIINAPSRLVLPVVELDRSSAIQVSPFSFPAQVAVERMCFVVVVLEPRWI